MKSLYLCPGHRGPCNRVIADRPGRCRRCRDSIKTELIIIIGSLVMAVEEEIYRLHRRVRELEDRMKKRLTCDS